MFKSKHCQEFRPLLILKGKLAFALPERLSYVTLFSNLGHIRFIECALGGDTYQAAKFLLVTHVCARTRWQVRCTPYSGVVIKAAFNAPGSRTSSGARVVSRVKGSFEESGERNLTQ